MTHSGVHPPPFGPPGSASQVNFRIRLADLAGMARSTLSRPEVLEATLGSLGLPLAAASAISADLVIRHPMTRRIGVRCMARTLRDQGIRGVDAESTATMLYALEGFDLGRTLQEIRAELRVAGIDGDLAVGAVFDAARLHRISSDPQQALPRTPPVGTLVAAALTTYTIAISLWLLAG